MCLLFFFYYSPSEWHYSIFVLSSLAEVHNYVQNWQCCCPAWAVALLGKAVWLTGLRQNMLSSPAEGGQWLLSQDGRAAQTWNGNLSSPLGGYALWLSTIFHSKALFDVATVFDLFSPFKPEADCFWPAATACLADFRSSALFDVCCSLHASPGTLAASAWSWDEQITH